MNKYFNGYLIAAVIIHAIITIAVIVAQSEIPLMSYFFVPFTGLNILGMALIAAGKPKAGTYIFFVGSIGFFPIGLIGMIGSRNVLDQLAKESFERRKEEANV